MYALTCLALGAIITHASAINLRTTTPPMGWNSYNKYGCTPTEAIIKQNADALVSQGLVDLGYNYVTIDCGWGQSQRVNNRLVWDTKAFPSGGKALGDYLHQRNLKFGLYSDAGIKMCGVETPGSLNYETIDAQTFAEWGGDALKYDNCWPDSKDKSGMVQYNYQEADTSRRFRTMADALAAVSRPIMYEVCQWGVGENVGRWASQIANAWRMSNDIGNNWQSIWRITNQIVPYWRHTGVGKYADMDMLEVGNNGLTNDEEKTHFGIWAIAKSPLHLGCSVIPGQTRTSSMDIIKNKEVIAINQDPLGEQARLLWRYSEEGYDIWAGNLSGSRKVVAIVNWSNNQATIPFNPAMVGVASAASVRDPYAARDLGALKGSTTFSIPKHGIQLLVLSDIVAASPLKELYYYKATSGTLSGGATISTCNSGTKCAPVGSKVGNLNKSSRVEIKNVNAGGSGKKLVGIDFINYEVALDSAWTNGVNIRQMMVSVNGKVKGFDFPISGGDWSETGRLQVELDGFVEGSGNVVGFTGGNGTPYAPDVVGFAILG